MSVLKNPHFNGEPKKVVSDEQSELSFKGVSLVNVVLKEIQHAEQLPHEFIDSEFKSMIEKSGYCEQQLELDELRQAVLAYLEKLNDEITQELQENS